MVKHTDHFKVGGVIYTTWFMFRYGAEVDYHSGEYYPKITLYLRANNLGLRKSRWSFPREYLVKDKIVQNKSYWMVKRIQVRRLPKNAIKVRGTTMDTHKKNIGWIILKM